MRSVFFAAMFTGLYILASTYGGRIEGRLFPVVVDVTIDRTEAVDSISSRLWGRFRKVRECNFVEIEFFLGSPNKSAAVSVTLEEGSKLRGNGIEEWGPWVVQLTGAQLQGIFYAVVTHDCHPFWKTKTIFY